MLEFHAPTVDDIPLLLTLLALELVLSFDNAAILAALANRLPPDQRRKALLYGLGGAYLFRIAAILGVVLILQNEWLVLVGAGYLLFLSFKHIIDRGTGSEHKARKAPQILGLSMLWSTIVYIELADVAFALDQILVAYALAGGDVVIIIIAALIAIIFLRISAYYIGRVMEWFPPLETLAYVAVGFVGVKMILAYEFAFAPWLHYEIPKLVSVVVTFSLIVVPPLAKYVLTKVRGQKVRLPEHSERLDELKQAEKSLEKGGEEATRAAPNEP